MDKYATLIGKKIVNGMLEKDGEYLQLWFEDGTWAKLVAEGDCCSQTWIESIDAPSALKGTILEMEDLEMPDLGKVGTEKHPDVEDVAYYGLRVKTDQGTAVIDFRNDSNGYYGGSLEVWTS